MINSINSENFKQLNDLLLILLNENKLSNQNFKKEYNLKKYL